MLISTSCCSCLFNYLYLPSITYYTKEPKIKGREKRRESPIRRDLSYRYKSSQERRSYMRHYSLRSPDHTISYTYPYTQDTFTSTPRIPLPLHPDYPLALHPDYLYLYTQDTLFVAVISPAQPTFAEGPKPEYSPDSPQVTQRVNYAHNWSSLPQNE